MERKNNDFSSIMTINLASTKSIDCKRK